MTQPDVSVVVICYNDAANLPKAVRSVLTQTLADLEVIVVDDASTDETPRVSAELAAEDPRVRVVRLPENSGGCSRPRNTGIEVARGTYVMFLDSDDTYERHACKNLLFAAERNDADIASGLCIRYNVSSTKTSRWYGWLYAERRLVPDIYSEPDLFFDTISTNKLYRRAFLDDHALRFPEGLHYEDQLFVAQAYYHADGIAIIPNLVYRWMVVPDAEHLSISSRRFELSNLQDRMQVNRLIDDFLVSVGADDLKPAKDYKFLRHDLRLYLNDLPLRPPDYQQRFMEIARAYLSSIDPEALERLDKVYRICVEFLRRGDLVETLKAIDYVRHDYKLSTDLVRRDDRVFWTTKGLDEPGMAEILDVTELGLHRKPFSAMSFFNSVESVQVRGRTLIVTGEVTNQLDLIPQDAEVALHVLMRNRGTKQSRFTRVAEIEHLGSRIRYTAQVDVGRLVSPVAPAQPVWDISLRITSRGQKSQAPFSVPASLEGGVRIPVGPDGTTGEAVSYVTINGNLAFRLDLPQRRDSDVTRLRRRVRRALRPVQRRSRRKGTGSQFKERFYRALTVLPVRSNTFVFESNMGKQYSDSPKYIYEAMRQQGFAGTAYWVHNGRTEGYPDDARLVQRGSWGYYAALARAQTWVDNQGFPAAITRRRGTTYLQTWHGTPLKKMGFDAPSLRNGTPARRAREKAMIERWDELLVPSEYFVDTFVKSHRYDGRLLRTGLPRNDRLVGTPDPVHVEELRERLTLPPDRKVLLYAPTFRDRDRQRGKRSTVPFDMQRMYETLGDEYLLLIRTHYLDQFRLPKQWMHFARDVSRYHDVTELMLVADVLVTDYSSVMFDYANTGRPMIFYAHDYEDYIRDQERGTYFDLAEEGPGPVVRDTEVLLASLKDLQGVQEAYRERYDAFRRRFCQYETGHAAQDVARHLLERG